MTTNPQMNVNTSNGTLHMAIELAARGWKLAFSDRVGRNARVRTMVAGDFEKLEREISAAKRIFGLDPSSCVISCYEAGRDGFWIHRCLVSMGIESHIVDPSSIQVNRKKRRAKTDRIDAQKIVAALMRFKAGDRWACRMIRIPEADVEDARHLNREMRTIKTERTAQTCRIKGLLVTQGIVIKVISRSFVDQLEQMQTADGKPIGKHLKERLIREFERLSLATKQIRTLQMQQANMIRTAAREIQNSVAERTSPLGAEMARHLVQLSGIGPVTAWTLSTEIFLWRDIANRRQLAALVGLVPTPNCSGDDQREQGISKSGRGELRVLMIEIAWGWLIHQPQSDLAKWYQERFGDGTKRNRKIGIVALARKLLVALGKYVRDGEIPAGAKLTSTKRFVFMPSLEPSKAKMSGCSGDTAI